MIIMNPTTRLLAGILLASLGMHAHAESACTSTAQKIVADFKAGDSTALAALQYLSNSGCLGQAAAATPSARELAESAGSLDLFPLEGLKAAEDSLQAVAIPADNLALGRMKQAALQSIQAASRAVRIGDVDSPALKNSNWSAAKRSDGWSFTLGSDMSQSFQVTNSVFDSCPETSAVKARPEACTVSFTALLGIVNSTEQAANTGIAEFLRPKFERAHQASRVRTKMWESYFETARVQYPWELLLNSWAVPSKKSTEGRPGFRTPPDFQIIALHPDVAVEYTPGAPDGSQFAPAVYVELLGINYWGGFKADGSMKNAIGISAITSYADREGVSDVRWGAMVHFRNKYSIAYTTADGHGGVLLSLQLGNKVKTTIKETETLSDLFSDDITKGDIQAACKLTIMEPLCP